MILVTRKAELDLMESWLPILYFVLQLLVDLDTGSEVPDPMPWNSTFYCRFESSLAHSNLSASLISL